MKKLMRSACVVGLGIALCGCNSTSTELFNPDDNTRNTDRSAETVSYAEYSEAAQAAVRDAIESATFKRFLSKYQKAHGTDNVPIMQVALIRNDTDDPDLNQKLITDEICNALLKSGVVDVTMATGADVRSTFADVRDLKKDKNFKQSTVAKQGTLEAPCLSLEGSIISNKVRDGGKTTVVRSFNLKIADIETGKVIWAYNKALGFKKTRGTFGW